MLNNFICIEDDTDNSECYINRDEISAIHIIGDVHTEDSEYPYNMTIYLSKGNIFTFSFAKSKTRSFYLHRILGVDD